MALDSYTKFLSHFNGADTNKELVDSGAIGHTATLVGTAQTTYTGSVTFNGSAYLTTADHADFAFGANNFTMEAWVLGGGSGTIIGQSKATDGDRQFIWDFNGSTSHFYYYTGASGAPTDGSITLTTSLTTGVWYHVALVRNGSDLKLYVDGVQSGSTYNIGGASLYNSSLNLYIGAYSASNGFFTGSLGEIRMSKVARTFSGKPATHYTPDSDTILLLPFGHLGLIDIEPTPKSISSSGVSYGAEGYLPPICKIGTNSLYLDGDSDYITIPASTDWQLGSGDFTLECFINLLSPSNGDQGMVISKWKQTGDSRCFEFFYGINSSSQLRLGFEYSTDGTSGTAVSGYSSYSDIESHTWYHIAFTRSGNTGYFFFDGNLVGTMNLTGITINAGTDDLWIGAEQTTTIAGYVEGYIDELRFSKGIARWTTSFTPPTSEYSPDSYDIFLSHFNGADSNKELVDSGNTGHVASLNGNAQTSCKGSAYFDGNSDYLTVPDSTDWYMGSGDATYECWVYASSFSGNPPIFPIMSQNEGTNWLFTIFYNNTGYFAVQQYENSAGRNWMVNTTGITMELNQWYHIAVTKTAKTWRIYINGTDYTQGTGTVSWDPVDYAGNFNIGYEYVTAGWYWGGYIDEVRVIKGSAIYTENFTPQTTPFKVSDETGTKLLLHFDDKNDSTTIPDECGKTVTAQGSAKISFDTAKVSPICKFGTSSLALDGSGDYVTIPDSDDWFFDTGNFTIDLWVYHTSLSHTDGGTYYFAQSTNSNTDFQWFVYNNGGLGFMSRSGGTYLAYYETVDTGLITTNNWIHVALVRSGTNLYMYVNGVRKSLTEHNAIGTNSLPNLTGSAYIGAWTSGATQWLIGYVDEFRVRKGTDGGWTGSTITVPTSAHTSDSYTKLLLHMDSQDVATTKQLTFNGDAKLKSNAIGATITYDGAYTIAKFTSSSSVRFSKAGNIECLVVAGGGGGGFGNVSTGTAGGGGAGGIVYKASQAVSASTYAITVGTGGAGATSGGAGTNGSNSSIGTLVVATGGGAGAGMSTSGNSGGSGGAAGGGGGTGGTGTTGQGYDGGSGGPGGGGGGGASEAGANASYVSGGAGGDGNSYSITGSSVTYGGGGGGGGYSPGEGGIQGPGGAGGGGLGGYANTTVGTAGTDGLGGGGGGGGWGGSAYGGDGGDGVVILRYLTSDNLLGSSLYLDGTGDYVTVPHSEDWDLGSGDFTIDCWARFAAQPSSESVMQIVSQWTASNKAWRFGYYNNSGTYKLWWNYTTDGSTESNIWPAWTATLDTWYHLAVVRKSGVTSIYVNGVMLIGSEDTATYYDSPASLSIGRSEAESGYYFNGYIDELRISKGIARWSGNFTPPTSAYSSDYDSKLLLHLNSLDVAGYKPLTFAGGAKLSTAQARFTATSPKATGGSITYYGGKTVHTFTGSGTFTPKYEMNVRALVVAGGGGGSNGGGGAGGYRYFSSIPVEVQSYSITVGTGGAAGVIDESEDIREGSNGTDSSAFGYTSAGGGGGGSAKVPYYSGLDGGSGGGTSYAGGYGPGYGNVPSTTPVQGYDGGLGTSAGDYCGGGGGGSSAVGGTEGYHHAGDGGAGTANSITGYSVYYAGGGGGGIAIHTGEPVGAGGVGGGGDGATEGSQAEDGTDGLGGGGGGAGFAATAGDGGDGVVIVAYDSGMASLALDGSGDYITVPDSDDWSFGTEDFTIDFWVNFGASVVSGGLFRSGTGSPAWLQAYYSTSSGSYIDFNAYHSSAYKVDKAWNWSPVANTWYHIAFIRNGTVMNCYVNGELLTVKATSTEIGTNSMPDVVATFDIGIESNGTVFTGYMDEFRISKGIARWTSNFNPPSREYGTSTTGSAIFYANNT